MKNQLLTLVLCAMCSTNLFANSIREDFNFNWKFSLSAEEGSYKQSLNDSKWSDVRLPHDWSIELGYTQENTAGSNAFLPGGIGWYRKSFTLPESSKGKQIFIHFDGVYSQSTVWVNGEKVGFYPNGYIGFEYDITPYLIYGKRENVICVKVDRSQYADTRWYVGGGIYRNVELITRNNIYIPTSGVFITTPNVSMNEAEVCVDVDVNLKKGAKIELKQELIEGESIKIVATKSATLQSGESTISSSFKIDNPMLWSLEQPAMYTLRNTILADGKVVDVKDNKFGVREIRFDAANGFFLNGIFTKLKGVNIHQDLGCVGVAAYDKVLYRRLLLLKQMGCNAIRTAHNPHSVSLLNMCDTMGLMVMNEAFDEWKRSKGKWIISRPSAQAPKEISTGYVEYFNDWSERDLKSFIKRDRNHPSVILWSIGNELEWTYGYYWQSCAENKKGVNGLVHTGGPEIQNEKILARFNEYCNGYDELSETAKDLVAWCKQVDTTRMVILGANLPSVSRLSGLMGALDVVGYNYKSTYYEIDHKRYPDQSIVGTENVGQYYEWRDVMDKPYIPGIFVWVGISYLGENGPWPAKSGNASFFDLACFKTSRGHFFECLWNDTPKTHIVTTPTEQSEFKTNEDGSFRYEFKNEQRASEFRGWAWFDTFDKWSYKDGEKIMVQVYSNSPQVELLINGKSLGTKNRSDFAQENILLWEVPYEAGELLAIGKVNGREVSRHSLKSNGKPTSVKIEIDNKKIEADRYDVAHIELSLIDTKSIPVCDTECEVEFVVDNKSLILGIDNGNVTYVGSHKVNSIETYNGKCLLIIQSKNGAKGESKIGVKLDGKLIKEFTVEYI